WRRRADRTAMHDAQTSILSRGGAALFRRMDVGDFRQAALRLGHWRRGRDFGLLSLRIVHIRIAHVTPLGRRNWLPKQPRDAINVPVAEPFGRLRRCRVTPFPEGASHARDPYPEFRFQPRLWRRQEAG